MSLGMIRWRGPIHVPPLLPQNRRGGGERDGTPGAPHRCAVRSPARRSKTPRPRRQLA